MSKSKTCESPERPKIASLLSSPLSEWCDGSCMGWTDPPITTLEAAECKNHARHRWEERRRAKPARTDFAGSVSEAQKSSYVVNTNVIFCSRRAGGENRIRVPREGDAALYVILARVMRR